MAGKQQSQPRKMPEGVNRVTLLGNLGSQPEIKVTPGGGVVLRFRLATNESYLDRSNVRQQRTEWHRIALWGRRGEALAKILKTGDRLFVEGRIQTSSYEKGGEKRYSTEIVATNIVLTGSRRRDDDDEDGPPAAPRDDAPTTDGDGIPF